MNIINTSTCLVIEYILYDLEEIVGGITSQVPIGQELKYTWGQRGKVKEWMYKTLERRDLWKKIRKKSTQRGTTVK